MKDDEKGATSTDVKTSEMEKPKRMSRKKKMDRIQQEALREAEEQIANSAGELKSYEDFAVRWKAEFLKMSEENQHHTLYNLINERLYWRIIYYMRRYPERLASSRATYSDRTIGYEELVGYMGAFSPESFSSQWLNDHHVPDVEKAIHKIVFLDAQIETLIKVESNNSIYKIKKYFALSDVELEILGTMVAALSQENLLRMMTVAWADFSLRLPSVTFLCQLLSDNSERYEEVLQALSATGTLRKMRLIIAEQHASFAGRTPLAYTPITVEQSVIDAYNGRMEGRELPSNMVIHKDALSVRSLTASKSVLEELNYLLSLPAARVCLVGERHAGRRTMMCSILQNQQARPVLEVDACREFENVALVDIEQRLAIVMREALLSSCVLLLRFDGLEEKPELAKRLAECQPSISRMVSYYPDVLVILANHALPFIEDAFNRPSVIHIVMPTVEISKDIWKKALSAWCESSAGERMAEVFSRNYSLPIGSIFGVVRDAMDALQASNQNESELQSHHILNEIRKSFRHQLGTLAEITVSDVPLSGVVLPPEARAQVNEILQYANNLHNVLDNWGFRKRSPYGNALSALFAGPPGTGKTLLACALANELGKVLYRVDLSRIVDKYIGETEKNLGKIFDEAAKAQAIILFDEADSLFAKRTEVKSSNDRYANLEINFLLQKLESYNGITILTTNLSKSIDEAFRRRLRFIIDFPMPDVSSRISLWKRLIPPEAPLSEDIRWEWLARTFEMSGGYIRNAVLKAAIAASAARSPISMDHLSRAAADEARSMGKLMRINDDYDYFDDDEEDNGEGRYDDF